MRAGDWIILTLVAFTAGLVALDGVADGALLSSLSQGLPGLAREAGEVLGYLGWALTPLFLLPWLLIITTQFKALPAFFEEFSKGLARSITAINTVIGDGARWFALGLVMVTAIIVIQRYVFGFSSTKLQESVIYMHALLFLLSSAATLIAGGHVRVDIIYNKLSPKGKAWTDLIGTYLALIPMCWIILTTSQSYVGGAWRTLERSRESDGIPLVFLLKTAIPVFAILMIAQGLALAINAALTLTDREETPALSAAESEGI